MTKVLLVGPLPPPHGGISVHVASARELLLRHGAACSVLDPGRAPGLPAALPEVRRHALHGYALHVHANGHNPKSWLSALACATAARRAPARALTLHSGMVPEYLASGAAARLLARRTIARFDVVVCVSAAVRDAVAGLGVERGKLLTMPAYLPASTPADALPLDILAWRAARAPLLTATLAFRPEYGFGLLLDAVARLAAGSPRIGCIVMGGEEGEEMEAARAQVRARGLGEQLLLLGDVSHDLCLALMAASDAFVRPTTRDGDSISVREALALGIPVVASDAARRPEGVHLHRTGDAAELAAAVAAALGSRRGARADGTAAPELLGTLLSAYAPRTPEGEPCCPAR